jgi:hypothetical protein
MNTGKTASAEARTPEADNPETRDGMNKQITHRRSEVRLGREAQARIGQQLRSMYDEVVKEGVPPHIAELVRRLSEQDDGVS